MIRFYCDVCKKELTKADHKVFHRKLGNVEVCVRIATEGVWNSGNVCHRCIMLVITKGK